MAKAVKVKSSAGGEMTRGGMGKRRMTKGATNCGVAAGDAPLSQTKAAVRASRFGPNSAALVFFFSFFQFSSPIAPPPFEHSLAILTVSDRLDATGVTPLALALTLCLATHPALHFLSPPLRFPALPLTPLVLLLLLRTYSV